MLRLALMGLVIVAAAGILAAVIFMLARAIMVLIGIVLFAGIAYLVLKLAWRQAFRTKRTS